MATEICDCGRGQNGLGIAGRECECQQPWCDRVEALEGQLHDLLASADAAILHEANDGLASGLRQARAENERLRAALRDAYLSLASIYGDLAREYDGTSGWIKTLAADAREAADAVRAALKQD